MAFKKILFSSRFNAINLKSYHLFIDGSVDPTSKIGFGAYLLLENLDEVLPKNKINYIKIEGTSSTRLELEVILAVIKKMEGIDLKLKIYTDSNAIISLLNRRQKLIEMDFYSKNNRLLNLHQLYKEFFKYYKPSHNEIIKIKGHSRSIEKDRLDRYFSIVDKASRKALRNYMRENYVS